MSVYRVLTFQWWFIVLTVTDLYRLLNVFQVSTNRMLSQLDFQIFHFKYRNPGVGMHIEVSVCGTVYFLRVTKTADQEGDSTPIRQNWMWADYVVISPVQADVLGQVLPTVTLYIGRECQVHFYLFPSFPQHNLINTRLLGNTWGK